MQVKSKPGTRCPIEGKPREYIGDAEPRDVPESSYYLRLVADGSLIRADVPPVSDNKAPSANADDLPVTGRQTATKAPKTQR